VRKSGTLTTPGMYSLGTAPPLISLTNVKPLLGSPGSNLHAGMGWISVR